MKTLFLKELAENRNWLILVFLTNCLIILIPQYIFDSDISRPFLLFFNFYQFKKLADRQLNSEMLQGTWQFLVLRAITPKQIVYAKLAAGVVLILLGLAVPYIASSLWAFEYKQQSLDLASPFSDDLLFVGCMLLVYFSFWLLSLYHFSGFKWLTWAGYIIGLLAIPSIVFFFHFVVSLVSATGGQPSITVVFLGVLTLTIYLIIYLPVVNGKQLMFGVKSQYAVIGVMVLLSLVCFVIFNAYKIQLHSSIYIAPEEKLYFNLNKQGDIVKSIFVQDYSPDNIIKKTVFDEKTLEAIKKREQERFEEWQLREIEMEKIRPKSLKKRPRRSYKTSPYISPLFLFKPDGGFASDDSVYLRRTGYYKFDLGDDEKLYFDPNNVVGIFEDDSIRTRLNSRGDFDRSSLESLLPASSERPFNESFISFSGRHLAFKNSIFYLSKVTSFKIYHSIDLAFTIPTDDAVRDIYHSYDTLYVLTEKYLSAYTINQKAKKNRRDAWPRYERLWQIDVSGKIDDYEAIAIFEIDEFGGYLLISQERDPRFRFMAFNEHKHIVDDFTLINEPRLNNLNQAQSLPPLFWLSPVIAFFNQLEFLRSGEAKTRFDSMLISRLTLIDWLLFFLSTGFVIVFTHRFCRKQQIPWFVHPFIYLWASAFGLVWFLLLCLLLLHQRKAKITCPHCHKKAKTNSTACQHCAKVFFPLPSQAMITD